MSLTPFLKKITLILSSIVLIFAPYKNVLGATVGSETQIIDAGGENTNSDGITVGKIISGTNEENVFDIELKVKAPYDIKNDFSTDVVVVMDISNTMNYTFAEGNHSANTFKQTRLSAAFDALNDFVDVYNDTFKWSMEDHKVGLVTFNSDSQKRFDFTDPSSLLDSKKNPSGVLKTAENNIKKLVFDSSSYSSSHSRFTDMEAGLQLAYDMMNESSADLKTIIFITDGFPTTYIKSKSGTNYLGYDTYTSKGTPGTDGVFYDNVTKNYCNSGTSYSDKAAEKAQSVAEAIKKDGINIYSVGVALNGQNLDNFERDKNAGLSVIDRQNKNTIISNKAGSVKTWLKDKVGSGVYYDASSAESLKSNLQDALAAAIENSINGVILRSATDPTTSISNTIDTNYIDFIHFYDDNNLPTSSLSGKNQINSENTATFSDNKINWNLEESGYTYDSVNKIKIYSLKYRIRLMNETKGFSGKTVYNTNGKTTLTYSTLEKGKVKNGGTIDFPLPKVEGYLADIDFAKIGSEEDETGKKSYRDLSGAEFALTHITSDHACDGKEGNIDLNTYTAISDENGKVTFKNVPSGHSYKLYETKSPDGYKKNPETHIIKIAYGKVYVDGQVDKDLTIENIKKVQYGKKEYSESSRVKNESESVKKGSIIGYRLNWIFDDDDITSGKMFDALSKGLTYNNDGVFSIYINSEKIENLKQFDSIENFEQYNGKDISYIFDSTKNEDGTTSLFCFVKNLPTGVRVESDFEYSATVNDDAIEKVNNEYHYEFNNNFSSKVFSLSNPIKTEPEIIFNITEEIPTLRPNTGTITREKSANKSSDLVPLFIIIVSAVLLTISEIARKKSYKTIKK